MRIVPYSHTEGKIIFPDEGDYTVHFIAHLPDSGGSETALVKGLDYYILAGDWCGEYEKRIDSGWDKCFEFYEKSPQFSKRFRKPPKNTKTNTLDSEKT